MKGNAESPEKFIMTKNLETDFLRRDGTARMPLRRSRRTILPIGHPGQGESFPGP